MVYEVMAVMFVLRKIVTGDHVKRKGRLEDSYIDCDLDQVRSCEFYRLFSRPSTAGINYIKRHMQR